MNPKLSKSLAVFRKSHITQHALLKIIGTWDYMLKEGNKIRAIVMDSSKAFDTLNHNLLCKLIAYGFDVNALTLIQSHLSNRYQIRRYIWQMTIFGKWQMVYPCSSIFQHFLLMISFFFL